MNLLKIKFLWKGAIKKKKQSILPLLNFLHEDIAIMVLETFNF